MEIRTARAQEELASDGRMIERTDFQMCLSNSPSLKTNELHLNGKNFTVPLCVGVFSCVGFKRECVCVCVV